MFFCSGCGGCSVKIRLKCYGKGQSHIGEYCADCGKWHKWLSKKELNSLYGQKKEKECSK